MNSPKLGEKCRNQCKRSKHPGQPSIDLSDGEAELSPSQILERVKSDRVAVTKPEEDRRRRTIIVEKKNGSYGFTLQSYGIHYKKEQEIEMITYVDYVDYDGPAYRAGMREGDVILSINGHDMEKTDHKTLVNFIKNCDSRMRMVVLFEDCVRKVELHMRYIQLQRVLQSKMVELERLCLRERELLQGKWKTHSLPARKKASNSRTTDVSTPTHPENGDISYCRPTVSTEDVAKAPPQFLLYPPYQYLDPHSRAYLLQTAGTPNSSGEYLVSWQSNYSSGSEHVRTSRESSRQRAPPTQYAESRRTSSSGLPTEMTRGYHQTNGISHKNKGKSSGHHCNPCVQTSPADNTSLEAYDLASPCCHSHCVPTSRRRSRSRHQHKAKRGSSDAAAANATARENGGGGGEWKNGKCCSRAVQVTSQGSACASPGGAGGGGHRVNGGRYLSLVSQCSLHSCTSSEFNCGGAGGGTVITNGTSTNDAATTAGGESSAASYTTSLSTDTLYWDQGPDGNGQASRQHSVKSNSSQRGPVKPKSWDNLTTKAFGGYGFGYGYFDRDVKSQHTGTSSTRSASCTTTTTTQQHNRTASQYQPAVQPTKSTESLLLPKYPPDSSLSCECLDASAAEKSPRFFSVTMTNGDYFYQNDKASQTESRRIVNVQQAPEVTRL
ncbi:homeotic protein female sterile isoform X2 [Nilaparvata lugens]|uniref:homeotic protein female sterile isoform X2 n=1 Tax=Nilaparvata lugens TaxID=108931 RepID=UPI00193DDF26|nr:homeotic protein female sterile isoform X2 [Nilaparvata lugens]